MNNDELSAPASRDNIHRILKHAHPDIKPLLMTAHEQEFRIKRTNNGHFQIMTPSHFREKLIRYAPGTPSDIRSVPRVKAKLRHIGVKFT